MNLKNTFAAFVLGVMAVLSIERIAMAADQWGGAPVAGTVAGMVVPAQTFAAITASNSTAIATGIPRAIYSHDGGTVACVDKSGTVMVTLFAAGEIKPLRCMRVNSTSTSSTVMYALY